METIEFDLETLALTDSTNDSTSPTSTKQVSKDENGFAALDWQFSVNLPQTHEPIVLQLTKFTPDETAPARTFRLTKRYDLVQVLASCHQPALGHRLDFVCSNVGTDGKARKFLEDRHTFHESFLILIRTVAGESFDLHLHVKRISSKHAHISGILISRAEYQRAVAAHMNRVITTRKIDLVLDIDDTLLRAHRKGDSDDGKTLTALENGTFVVLADDVWKFLEFAERHFTIHLYSCGDEGYVKRVANLFNQKKRYICGKLMSGYRDAKVQSRAPKSLARLFPHETESMRPEGLIVIRALIVDDVPEVWEFQDRMSVIQPRVQQLDQVFQGGLLRVLGILQPTIKEFWRQWDQWEDSGHVGKTPCTQQVLYQQIQKFRGISM
ncbi:UNVERIFIED_CONTAM: RNA polymerase II [Siphonaria sp. JEL0065]|nr:RNA polymerase II [Siphonaria sp. JEL0065]